VVRPTRHHTSCDTRAAPSEPYTPTTALLFATGDGNANWVHKCNQEVKAKLTAVFDTVCKCKPAAQLCTNCRVVVCNVGGEKAVVPLRVKDLKTLRERQWLNSVTLDAKFNQLQAHNDKMARCVLVLTDGTKVKVPRVRILDTSVSITLSNPNLLRRPNWNDGIRALNIGPSRNAAHNLWDSKERFEKMLVPLNMCDIMGNLAASSNGIHWAGLVVGVGRGNETFTYWDSLVRGCPCNPPLDLIISSLAARVAQPCSPTST
jgi:hypothetical protein